MAALASCSPTNAFPIVSFIRDKSVGFTPISDGPRIDKETRILSFVDLCASEVAMQASPYPIVPLLSIISTIVDSGVCTAELDML